MYIGSQSHIYCWVGPSKLQEEIHLTKGIVMTKTNNGKDNELKKMNHSLRKALAQESKL